MGHGLRGGKKNTGTVLTSLQLAFRGRDRDFTTFTILLLNKLCFQWKLCQTHLASFSMLQTSPTQFRNRVFYINSYWNILLIKIGKHTLLKHFPNQSSSIIASTSIIVEPRLMATLVIRSPRYYSHFFGHLAKIAMHFLVEKPLLIRPNFFGPVVTVLLGFHLTVKQLLKPPDSKAGNFWQEVSFCIFVAIISIHFGDTFYVFIQNSPTGYLA